MANITQTIKSLPSTPGVYLMKDKIGKVIYVGKAASLKSRVSSYFTGAHDAKTETLVANIAKIDYIKTDSVIEALILESQLIKKYDPQYNIEGKDDKSFINIYITKEDFSRIFSGREADLKNIETAYTFGPYTSAKQARTALEIIRKIFPYRSCAVMPKKRCLYGQIGRCSMPCEGLISKTAYKKIVQNIAHFLRGNKKMLVKKLEKEMENQAKNENFEEAARLRNILFSLRHIQDVALIGKEEKDKAVSAAAKAGADRIEGYDISNISGADSVGSMVVFTGGRPDKAEYKKFKIRMAKGINDIAMLEEVLTRRFKHKEWKTPDIILIDGGLGQLNAAKKVLKAYNLNIPIVAMAKGPTRKKADLRYFGAVPEVDLDILKQARDEAHRFAISFHRKLRERI